MQLSKSCGRSGCIAMTMPKNSTTDYITYAKSLNSWLSPKRFISGIYKWNYSSSGWNEIYSTKMNTTGVFYETVYPANNQDALYCLTLRNDLAKEKTTIKVIPTRINKYDSGGDSNVYQLYHYSGKDD